MFECEKSVRKWFSNLPNIGTRRTYLYVLMKYVKYARMRPDELETNGKTNPKEAHDLLKMFYNSLNLASTTKMLAYQAIRSFYIANHIFLGKKPATFRVVVEYEPRKLYTQDEVATLVDVANNIRDKALVCFLAQSGQRLGIITGLRLRHVDLDQASPLVVDLPAVLKNKHGVNVNKAQIAYRFVIGEDTKNYLKLMVEERTQRGEPLSDDSWLFRSHSTRLSDRIIRKVRLSTPGEPLSGSQIWKIVHDAATKRGIQKNFGKRYLFHPHGFRRYWKHQLRMGGFDPDLLDYMMGHVLPYGGAYDRWTLEDIRSQYKRAENMVSLRPVLTVTKEEVGTEVLKVLLGKMSQKDYDRISESLGLPSTQIQSLIKALSEE